ncbi:MAG: sensor histidine kinase [Pirellulaceae bacterium]
MDESNRGEVRSDSNQEAGSQWIAYELHDGLLQWILGARMQLDGIARQLEGIEEVPSRARVQFEVTRKMLESAAEEGRHLIGFLEAGAGAVMSAETAADANSNSGLVPELQAFIDRSESRLAGQARLADESGGIQLQCESQAWMRLAPRAQWNILRMLQQAISNAVQHAGQCEIVVRIQDEESEGEVSRLVFVVADTGVGFDPDQAVSNHFGIKGMRHRARLIDASIELHSARNEGTEVRISIPVPSP